MPAELSPLRYDPFPVAVAADPAVAAFAPAPFESSFFSTLAGIPFLMLNQPRINTR